MVGIGSDDPRIIKIGGKSPNKVSKWNDLYSASSAYCEPCNVTVHVFV